MRYLAGKISHEEAPLCLPCCAENYELATVCVRVT